METINFPKSGYKQVGARGVCPYSRCAVPSYFQPVQEGHTEDWGSGERICNVAICQACKNPVLVVAQRQRGHGLAFGSGRVYPKAEVKDQVDTTIPPAIAADYSEAKRCRGKDAFKATVVMCRRAIQASALDKLPEKSPARDAHLVDQIDALAKNGDITEPLRGMAHDIRLEGNIGAHPDKDGLEDVTEQDADDILSFTEHFFQHVYVMPAAKKARDERNTPEKAAEAEPTEAPETPST